MSHRLYQLGLVVCLAGAGIAAAESRVRDPRDLDDYSDEQLLRDLQDELDDIYSEVDPNGEYELGVLREDILYALGDAGDEGFEAEIDFADLEAEMQEAETSLEEVVDEALARADELALRPAGFRLYYAGLGANSQKRDKATQPAVAVRETGRGVLLKIRAAPN